MSHKQLTDMELDALVIRSLARLPSYAPSRGFDARVLARVQRPAPRAVRLARRAGAWALQPRRAAALVVGYAAAAVIGFAAAVPWLLSHAPAIGLVLDWTQRNALAVVHRASAAFAGWTLSSGLASQLQSISFSSPVVVASAVALTAGYVGCALGLRHLLHEPRGADALVTA